MNRSRDMLGIAAACVLALGAVLAGCARHVHSSVANSPAVLASSSAIVDGTRGASDKASAQRDEPSVASGDLPVVVIVGHRQGLRPLVLSERNPGSQRD